ncbi:MAG: DUF47 family protein [Gemmataceae bacterium]|nr:DUF47 family protein [Gemmataceae bacterium]
MRFSLIPREAKFFDMFDQTGDILVRGAGKFLDMVQKFDDLPRRARDMKIEEDACDEIVGQIIKALDRSFITPFDREDIHTLAAKLDDVMDNMEETAHRLLVFRIDRPTEAAVQLAQIVHDCCGRLREAIRALRDLKSADPVQQHLRAISNLENEADHIYRASDADLFAKAVANGAGGGTIDVLTLIKWRELYAWLENTVDACKDVARVISEIVIKGT